MKTAFITGITGQIGTYLARLLLAEGYNVVGTTRSPLSGRHDSLREAGVRLVLANPFHNYGYALRCALDWYKPSEVYNLAGESSAEHCRQNPMNALFANGAAAIELYRAVLEACPEARVFQASSSRVFGYASDCYETSRRSPYCPYGAAKAYADTMAQWFRCERELWIASGILFSFESPLRRSEFVSRKLSLAAARIKLGLQDHVVLDGPLESRRDWGFAGDAARAAWLMLQQDVPQDFVIGTGELHSVADMAEAAFAAVDLDWKQFVRVSASATRGTGPELRADSSRLRGMTGWEPSVDFQSMVKMMVENDLRVNSQ